MITRKATRTLAEAYMLRFVRYYAVSSVSGTRARNDVDGFYDFLFDHNYEPWFCNIARKYYDPRAAQDFIMKLHTGETFASETPNWSWEKRQQLGQRYLQNLAEDILQDWKSRISYRLYE